jgi:hypothetical protein
MAARGSASTGVVVFSVIMSVAALGFFITTLVFYARDNGSREALANAEANNREFITDADRTNPVLARIKEEAKKQRKSATAWLLTQQEDVMRKTLGQPTGTPEQLAKELEAIGGEEGKAGSAVGLLRSFKSKITSLEQQLADATASADRARQDKEAEAARTGTIKKSYDESTARLTAQVGETRELADKFRDELDKFKADMDARVDGIRADYATREKAMQTQIEQLQGERKIDRERISTLTVAAQSARFTGRSEDSLVDGTVIGLNAADGTVVLGVGRKDKVTLGLTFEVYSDGSAIRPDERTGEYPRGKASLEVIRVDQESSVARVLREQRGNPVVSGDAVANALFDPRKTYKFLVFGNFDPTRSGSASALGGADIKAKIKSWGGAITDELSGDVDFIVLGQRPILPPQPAATAPFEVVEEFLRIQRLSKRYDDLLQSAKAGSIPVLNENRLYTLIGM